MGKKMMPSSRQAAIMRWLEEVGTLTIEQLVNKFEVSVMTVHRDLDYLQMGGKVQKVHGGVVLAQIGRNRERTAVCPLCNDKISAHTQFIITWEGGEQGTYCCPHCGLLALDGTAKTAVSALASDFLYGRMINVYQAFYVIDSDVQLCCIPSTICFATVADAEKFQCGFGGQLMTYTTAFTHLTTIHRQ